MGACEKGGPRKRDNAAKNRCLARDRGGLGPFLSFPATRKTKFRREKNLSCQTRSVGTIPRLPRPRGLVHGTVCNRYAHIPIARSWEKIGRWGLGPSTKARRVQTRQSRADRRRLFFFPVQYASLHNPPRARKETSKRPSWLSRARHTKIPAADKACSHAHEMPPKRRRRGRHLSPHAQLVNPVVLFFPKTSRSGRSRCRYAGATQRRRPPCWTRRQSTCGACGFPRTNTRPVLSSSLGPTFHLPRKRTTRRRRESKGPRPLQPRHNYATSDTK